MSLENLISDFTVSDWFDAPQNVSDLPENTPESNKPQRSGSAISLSVDTSQMASPLISVLRRCCLTPSSFTVSFGTSTSMISIRDAQQ